MTKYKILLAEDAKIDIQETRRYILEKFHYREYAENYSESIRKAIESLEFFAEAHKVTGITIDGYPIYCYPRSTYLIFYIIENHGLMVIRVLKNRMAWQRIIKHIKTIKI